MMTGEDLDRVNSKATLIQFIRKLLEEYEAHGEEWENPTLDRFLEALAAWLEDSDGYFINMGLPIPENASWQLVAQMLWSATAYE